jgi:hypothetical protein
MTVLSWALIAVIVIVACTEYIHSKDPPSSPSSISRSCRENEFAHSRFISLWQQQVYLHTPWLAAALPHLA